MRPASLIFRKVALPSSNHAFAPALLRLATPPASSSIAHLQPLLLGEWRPEASRDAEREEVDAFAGAHCIARAEPMRVRPL
jgi:hypothetical protein